MAQAKVQHVTTYHLSVELSPNELDKLKSMMQNPLGGVHPDDEDPLEKGIRKALFDACNAHRT